MQSWKTVKVKERIRLIKILLQQSWNHRYCISSVQQQCVFLAKAHSIAIASLHSNVLSQSLVPMIQLREMAFSSSLPSNLCHLGLQTRALTFGSNLPIMFWHLRYIRMNEYYKSKICWTPNIVHPRGTLHKTRWQFFKLHKNIFLFYEEGMSRETVCVSVS